MNRMCKERSLGALWASAFTVETLAIIIANVFSITIFWKRRIQLRRTRYLLLNLSVADLMFGVANLFELVIMKMRKPLFLTGTSLWEEHVTFEDIFGSASIFFLVLVSLERLFAMAWPFRLRTVSTRRYFKVVGACWLFAGLVALIEQMVVFKLISHLSYVWLVSVSCFVCLTLITCSYSLIWILNKKEDPRLPANCRKHNKELAKTLFLVTLLSLMAWLPFIIINFGRFIVEENGGDMLTFLCHPSKFLLLANSLINPIIYSFRMPEFRRAINGTICLGERSRFRILKESATNSIVLISVRSFSI